MPDLKELIPIEVQYSTPPFRDIDVPQLSAVQRGKRLTIIPRWVKVYPAEGTREHMRVYVEGRSVIQSTGMLGQHNRSILFGTNSGRIYDDTVPLAEAPGWLAEIVQRVEQFERNRIDGANGNEEP